jgi:hypothetical protein
MLSLAVALTGLGCDSGGGDACADVVGLCETLGAVRCNTAGNGTEQCQANTDGCQVWTAYQTCGVAQTCQAGLCRCENTCAGAGQTQCAGSVVQTCTADADGCLAWVSGVDCADQGLLCEAAGGSAICTDVCQNECETVGATQCASATVLQTCSVGTDGCNDWVSSNCGATESCQTAGGVSQCVACTPDCGTRECGMDPVCGTLECGTCEANETCSAAVMCEDACEPDCQSRECGMDPVCGTLECGTCEANEVCVVATGMCLECTPDCGTQECGVDPVCGASCGTCDAGYVCDASNMCVLDCTGECALGDERCSADFAAIETCAATAGCNDWAVVPCPTGEACELVAGTPTCVGACVPDCGTRECGMDPVCGTLECGTCEAGETCNADGMCEACTPDCGTRECGPVPNGCGASCGTCQAGEFCNALGMCESGSGCTELIVDGGFEGGTPSANWTETSTNYGTPLCTAGTCGVGGGTGPYAGTFWAWFGGFGGGPEDATASQSVTLPAGQTATLFFYLEIPVSEGLATDFLEVTLDGTQVFLADGTMSAQYNPYTLVEVDLSSFADGAAHTLEFHGYTNSLAGAATNFFVDNVSLGIGNQCCVGECTVGTAECQGNVVFDCVADASGCGSWTLGEDCSPNGDICVAGTCMSTGCSDIGTAVGPSVATGSNAGMPNLFDPGCVTNNQGLDVCFTWTAPADGGYIINTTGSSYDTVLMVYANGVEIACNDDSGGVLQSLVVIDAVGGQQYTLVVDAYGTATGTFILNIEVPECSPGAYRCLDAMTRQVCAATGLWGATTACVIGCDDTLDPPACTTICTPGETRCNADTVTLETCSATGEAWNATTCPNGCETLPGGGARCVMLCADIGSSVGPAVATGSTAGLPNSMTGTCGGGAVGPDTCFTFTAPAADAYIFDTIGSSYDTVLYVRDALTGTELACNDDIGGGVLQSRVTVPLAAGQAVYVVVDAYSATASGTYVLNIGVPQPESICDDWVDNDGDLFYDCSDDTACAGTPACTPGAGPVGAPCTTHSDCASNAGSDPACFVEDFGFPGGHCSEWCDIQAQDCAAGSTCSQLYFGGVALPEGLCLIACTSSADCPTGYTCSLDMQPAPACFL